MDNKDLTEFGRRESGHLQNVKNDNELSHAGRYKYSAEKFNIIKKGLYMGCSIKGVCGVAGISVKTYYRWRDEIEEFRDMVDGARGAVEMVHHELAYEKGDLKALQWIMERRYPDEWGKRQEVDVTIKEQTGSEVVMGMLTNVIEQDNPTKENLIDQESEDQ